MTDHTTDTALQNVKQKSGQVTIDREPAEQVLQYFEYAVKFSSDAIGMSNADGRHWFQNRAFDELFGDVGSDPPASLYVDEDAGRRIFHTIKNGESWNGEVEMYGKNGAILHIMLRAYPVKDQSGNVTALVGVHTNITERRQAEDKIKANEVYLTKAQEIARLGHFSYNPETDMINGSLEVFHIFGINPANRSLVFFARAVHPEDRNRVYSLIDRAIKKGCSFDVEHRVIHASGDVVHVHVKGELANTHGGKRLFGIAQDISDRKLIEASLKEAKRQLETKVEERTREIGEKNIALKVLSERRENDKQKLIESMVANVQELLVPNIRLLKNSVLSSRQRTALNILEANLHEIVSPFISSLSTRYLTLTPTEVKVANYIKHGASSKEIADSLGLSQRTIDTHRYNIRRKLGISGERINLRTYLSSQP